MFSCSVITCERAPIVSVDNSVRIKHRDNLENEHFSEFLSLLGVTEEVVEKPLHHEAGDWFSRMHPGSHDDAFPFWRIYTIR